MYKRYIKNTRYKCGIKFSELITNGVYVLEISFYSVKCESEDNNLGKTAVGFINVLNSYLDKGYYVFADNYFYSFYLAKYLAVFNIEERQKRNPKPVIDKKLKKDGLL